ncbi:MAG: MarR family transcriptional regulator [Clostridia bacterium]|nr:MarR family transcriptional regulator [Clostridia bacterium]
MPSISRCINILSRASGMFRAANVKNEELKPCLQSYILTLTRTPGLSQEQIARRLCVDKSSVARALASLEKMGYVERRRHETDRRITLVYPSEKAVDAREGIRSAYRAWNEYINEAFSEEEAKQFIELLEKAAERAAEYAQQKLDSDGFSEDGGGEDK